MGVTEALGGGGGNIPRRDTSPADIHRMMVRPPDCAFTATPDGEIKIPAPITEMYRLNSTVLVSLLSRVYHLERLMTHLAADSHDCYSHGC